MAKDVGRSAGADASRPKASIPSAAPPLQPVTGFLGAMADRFQDAHVPPLCRDRAILLAVETLAEFEADCGAFHHPDFDWSLEAALAIANSHIEHWERADGTTD